MSVSDVSFNEDILIVTVDDTAPPTIAITPAPLVVEIAGSGLQGAPGPSGPAGSVGPAGPEGPEGPPGNAPVFYHHDQSIASATWTVIHNLGYNPAVTVIDSAGTHCEGGIEYVDPNTLILTFSAAFAGSADCS